MKPNSNSKWYNTLKGTNLYDMVDTFADLKNVEPKDGMRIQVNSDENHNNEPIIYVYNNNKWVVDPESKDTIKQSSIISKYLDSKKKSINKKSTITRNAEALLQYDLSPVLINDAVRLFDPENDTMIQVVGISKDNQDVLKGISNKTDDEYKQLDVDEEHDKLVIRPYSKVMYPHDEYTYNVTFAIDKKPTYEMSVADFKNKIYNQSYNQEAVLNAEKDKDFSDKELVLKALNKHDTELNQTKYDNLEQAANELNPNLYKDIKEKYRTKVLNTLTKKKQDGWTDEDLDFLMKEYTVYLDWLDENEKVFQAVEELCGDNKDSLKALEKQKEKWFREDLSLNDLVKEVGKWYKSVKGTFTEAKYISPIPKTPRVTDPGDVAEILEQLGIDAKYLRVPFLNLDDDNEYRIQGFENQNDISEVLDLQNKVGSKYELQQGLLLKQQELDNIRNTTKDAQAYLQAAEEYNSINKQIKDIEENEKQLKNKVATTIVLIKKYEEGKEQGIPVKMTLEDVYRHLSKPANQNSELNVPEHDLNNPNENLNQHKFYKVDLSPEVIKKIVDHAVDKYKDEVPRGYSIPHGLTGDTWEKYINTRALLDTLNMANSDNNKNYKIEKATVQGKTVYRGVIPYNPKARMNSFPRQSMTKMV